MGSNEIAVEPRDWDALWAVVGESLLGGLHHALNNRVAALSAISQVLGSGMPDAAPLVASLSGEVNRLEATVALLAHLRRARTGRAEPVQLPELVAALPPLLAQHSDLKETVFVTVADPGVLPAWAERDLLTRVVLCLLVAVGLDAQWGGCRRVVVGYRGDEATVSLRVACERDGDTGGPPDSLVERLDARGTAGPLRAMGGQLEMKAGPGGELAYELSLPTLLAARRGAAV